MAKILRPQLLPLGQRLSQAFVQQCFLKGLRSYAKGNISFTSKVEQIFTNAAVKEGNFVFHPETMEDKMPVSAVYEKTVQAATEAYSHVTDTVDKLVISTEIPGCPPLGHLLPHNNTVTLAGHGCFGGISLLKYAKEYLKAYPSHSVGLYAVEVTSRVWPTQFPTLLKSLVDLDVLHQQGKGLKKEIYQDIIGNIVVAAIVRDNAIFTKVLGPEHPAYKKEEGWVLQDYIEEKMPAGLKFVGSLPSHYGSHMFLSPLIPSFVAPQAAKLVKSFISSRPLHHTLVHPGGAKVLVEVEKAYGQPLPLSYSWDSLGQFGNCLSASVFDVIRRNFPYAKTGENGIIYGVGPGMFHGVHYVRKG